MGNRMTVSPVVPAPASGVNGQGEAPVYRNGVLISPSTGLPFSGVNPYDGKTYKNGVPVVAPPGTQFIPGTTTPIDPNNVSQRYKAVSVEKNPAVSSATDSLLNEFKTSAASSLDDFSSYLKNFKDQIGVANNQGQDATNIAPYAQDLIAQQNRYSNALTGAVTGAAANNANAAAQEQAILAQEQNNNRVGMNNALTASEQLQLGQLGAQVNRYKLGTGTPSSLGSDELAMQAAGARAIAVPIELQRVQNEQNILQNTALPIVQTDAARQQQFWQNFVPGVAGSQYQSGTDVSNQIQKLKMTVSNMSYDNAVRYMQSLGVPPQIQQQILSGQIGELGGFNSLYGGSRYQSLQDILGVNLSQPTGASPTFGGLPQSRYPVSNAPINVNGSPATNTGTGGYGGSVVDPNSWAQYTAQQNAQVVPYSRYNSYQTPAGAGAPVGGYRGFDLNGIPIGTEQYNDYYYGPQDNLGVQNQNYA